MLFSRQLITDDGSDILLLATQSSFKYIPCHVECNKYDLVFTQSVIRIVLVSLHMPVTVLGNRVTVDRFLPILACA